MTIRSWRYRDSHNRVAVTEGKTDADAVATSVREHFEYDGETDQFEATKNYDGTWSIRSRRKVPRDG